MDDPFGPTGFVEECVHQRHEPLVLLFSEFLVEEVGDHDVADGELVRRAPPDEVVPRKSCPLPIVLKKVLTLGISGSQPVGPRRISQVNGKKKS